MSKSGVNGVLLAEAKYINLSLHFLEQVKMNIQAPRLLKKILAQLS